MAQRQFASGDTSTWSEKYGNGVDGSLTISSDTTDSTPNTYCSGTLASNTLTVNSYTGFADGSLLLIHQTRNGGDGQGNWELNKIASGGSTTTWTLTYALTHNYDTTAQVYLLKQYSSVTIDSGKTLTASAWNGAIGGIIALLCNGTTTITGTLVNNIKGYRYGAGATGAYVGGTQGEGITGLGTAITSANAGGGGGGGHARNYPWSAGGGGGGGGNGSAGTNGGNDGGNPAPGGIGGNQEGSVDLTTIFFGGGGGGGGGDEAEFGQYNGRAMNGGTGGGIILIISSNLTVNGGINSNGDNGEVLNVSNRIGCGGGGSGGSILLKGVNITLGSNLVTAIGGIGSQDPQRGNIGGVGGDGRIHADYSTSISGTTNPTLDSTQDATENTSTSTSSSITTTTSTSTTTTQSQTTSTSITTTSSSTSLTSTSTTSTSSSTSLTTTSTTQTSTTITLPFHLDVDRGR